MMEFMRGRYGLDQLGIFLMIASFALELIGNLFRLRFIYWIGLALFFLLVFRVFSRNIYKRQAENEKFLNIKNAFNRKGYARKSKGNGRSGPVYAYYYCPACKQQVRVPAGKGKIKVTCPTCGEIFEMHS
ncbi:MAG: zinc ribbon domain-containing protein [Anaerovoracaceae bacterium]